MRGGSQGATKSRVKRLFRGELVVFTDVWINVVLFTLAPQKI